MQERKPPPKLNLEKASFINNEGKVFIELKVDKPEKLYKYYALNSNNINGLENSTIYFSQANILNDILEGNFELLWDFENFYKKSELEEDHKKYIITNLPNYKKDFLRWRGVFSMCSHYKNELLWVHYTNECGYCIELDFDKLISHFDLNNSNNQAYFFPISYPKKMEKKDFNDLYLHIKEKKTIDIKLAILNCFANKEYHWEYEDEWRIMLNNEKFNYVSEPTQILDDISKKQEDYQKSGGNIEVPRDAIIKIILAPLFFNNSRFNKYELIEGNFKYEIYNFKDNEDGKLAYGFLKTLKNHYSKNIFQINKIVNKNKEIERDITHKIDIIDVTESFVKIKKTAREFS